MAVIGVACDVGNTGALGGGDCGDAGVLDGGVSAVFVGAVGAGVVLVSLLLVEEKLPPATKAIPLAMNIIAIKITSNKKAREDLLFCGLVL